jgi:hypothetical protein
MKRYRQKHKANSAKYNKMKKKDREENRQKESSKKKKQLNDNNQKLLNDRMKWKMQKKNIQGKQTKNLMTMKIILAWTKQNCFKQR